MLLAHQPCQILIAWQEMLVGVHFAECLSEHPKQLLEERHVRARESSIGVAGRGNRDMLPSLKRGASTPAASTRMRFAASGRTPTIMARARAKEASSSGVDRRILH